MDRLLSLPAVGWDARFTTDDRRHALAGLESGRVLLLPLAFPLEAHEARFLDPAILGRAKNVSFDAARNALGGTVAVGEDATRLGTLLRRYGDRTQQLLDRLLPYGPALRRERTSLRPAKVEGRVTSWRKDDSRLHVDSFPSQPTGGRRLLRVFVNVNPGGRPRTWRVGEPFADAAARFWPRLASPSWVKREILSLIRVTKGRRSDYDHYMLGLHDAMKGDGDYQRTCPQETIDFRAGSTWVCFTDQVSHAAMAGQHQLEQTFTLPAEALATPEAGPLGVLQRLARRPLLPTVSRRAA